MFAGEYLEFCQNIRSLPFAPLSLSPGSLLGTNLKPLRMCHRRLRQTFGRKPEPVHPSNGLRVRTNPFLPLNDAHASSGSYQVPSRQSPVVMMAVVVVMMMLPTSSCMLHVAGTKMRIVWIFEVLPQGIVWEREQFGAGGG